MNNNRDNKRDLNGLSVHAVTDQLMNPNTTSDSSCEESEDEQSQQTTDDLILLDSTLPSSSKSVTPVEPRVTNLLSQLHRPTSSELSRKRVIDRNPPKGKKRSKGPNRRCDPKSVSPGQRLRNPRYASECLTVSMGKLFCQACREELSIKTSVLNNHIKSSKHISGKNRLQSKQKKDIEIVME